MKNIKYEVRDIFNHEWASRVLTAPNEFNEVNMMLRIECGFSSVRNMVVEALKEEMGE